MRRLLRLVFVICLLAGARPPCVAGTTADLLPIFTYKPLPRYPMDAWERRSNGSRRIEGVTVCRIYLDAKGVVTKVEVVKSSGSKILDAASTEALRNWRAKPGRPGRFTVPICFEQGSPRADIYDGLGFSKSSDVGK